MNNQQAINFLKDLEKSLDDYCELNNEGKTAFGMAITALELFGNSEQLPFAQPERMRGKWIDDGDPFMWECGCCGYRVKRYNNTRYCPNCGADMREVDDERPD